MLRDELVINYHITEKCNYACRHCYAKWNVNDNQEIHTDMTQVEILLNNLYDFFSKRSKRLRLNLAGGEPLLCKHIGKIIELANSIGFRVSIISNGSALTEKFVRSHAKQLSVLGLSIDSLQPSRLKKIGRLSRNGQHLSEQKWFELIKLLRDSNETLLIKINTVVCQFNYDEYLGEFIDKIAPDKWKIFRVLPLDNNSVRISHHEFSLFLDNHKQVTMPYYIENNEDMTESYIMVDPIGRFYQNSPAHHGYTYSQCITEIGIEKAFNQINFNLDKYHNRYILRR
ncbi:conserved hypothetical protein [Beggiatoa sp. PS]|nr:conserved hypothetical protein [Beggiatoa sp. PS]